MTTTPTSEKFMTALGLTEFLGDEKDKYFPVQNLIENKLGPDLYDAIMERFGTKEYAEWKEILTDADIPSPSLRTGRNSRRRTSIQRLLPQDGIPERRTYPRQSTGSLHRNGQDSL